jgi:hypothetical protein
MMLLRAPTGTRRHALYVPRFEGVSPSIPSTTAHPVTPRSLPSPPPHSVASSTPVTRERADGECTARAQRSLTFWTSDVHSGVICDLVSMLPGLGHRVVNAGEKGRRLPYPAVLDSPRVEMPSRPLAPVLQDEHYAQEGDFTQTEEDARALFSYYKDDPQFAKVDAFVCMFPAATCELFMPFNKSIILLAGHRYSLRRCSPSAWQGLSDHIRMLETAGRGHVIAGITQYDVEYIRYFTGVRPRLLMATSLWYAFDPAQYPYTKRRAEVLVGPLQRTSFAQFGTMQHYAGARWTFAFARTLYGRFELNNIADHRAFIVLPYAVTSFGIIEVYALGVPMLVPDPAFLYKLGTMDDRRMRDGPYCGGSVEVPKQHKDSSHPYSPEDADFESFSYWIKFADFYTWPHIQTFSSWDDLVVKLDRMDFDAVHAAMMDENAARKVNLARAWAEATCKVEQGRMVPREYDTAIKELWGVSKLMSS